ncbi:glycerol kinase [Oceanobacillus longus]|uniref:Glycerol kinase n=1 Tax=Oceanobacillus longus TaxID=930120 RepID=A0ABV8GVW8_9BACI
MAIKNQVKYLSTTALSKELKMGVKDVFQVLLDNDYITRVNEKWELTENGKQSGGITKKHPKIGEYIAWQEDLKTNTMFKTSNEILLNATALSAHFGVSKFKMNPILSELGFIQKSVKGWTVTKLGLSIGGEQLEYDRTGVPYVNWPESILKNKRLLETIRELEGNEPVEPKRISEDQNSLGFREKFVAKHRSADGHYVRSRAEMLIDNWLYMSEIAHAYERKLPIEEDVYTDFYLPVGKYT